MIQNNSEFFILTQDRQVLKCVEGRNIYITDFPQKGKETTYCIVVKGLDNQCLGIYNTWEKAEVVLEAIADSIMAGDRVFKMPS
jgi:hypothetical protein